MILCGFLCLRGSGTASAAQIVMALLLILGVIFVFFAAFFRADTATVLEPAYSPDHMPGIGILFIVSLGPWAFAGFESISNSTEEFRFSPKKSLGIMVIALLTAAGIRVLLRYYGAAFGGAGIAAAFCMILARTAGIPEMISEASEGMSRQAGLAFRGMALETGLYILILLAAGTACLAAYIRSGKGGNRRGGKHA